MPSEEMQIALEEHVVALIREAIPNSETLRTIAIGEPFTFPTEWLPMATVFCRQDEPAEDEGYAPQETELAYFAYRFYVSFEVAFADAIATAPDSAGVIRVPSYGLTRFGIEAIRRRLEAWQNDHDSDQVSVFVGTDAEEQSAQILMGGRDTAVENRGDSWFQRAVVEFTVYTHRRR